MQVRASCSTHRCIWMICSVSVVFLIIFYLIIDDTADLVWIRNVINQQISPNSISRSLLDDGQTRQGESESSDIDAEPGWEAKSPSPPSPSLSIIAASFDILNHPDAPKLQEMLTNKKFLKTLNTSCKTEDAHIYPYHKGVKATALMSFPRSGNTWTRSLVEKSTGYSTTSIYCGRLKFSLVPNCDQSSEFLVKTHSPGATFSFNGRQRSFDQIIYLVRNPFDSIFSYHIFQSTGQNQPVSSSPQKENGTERRSQPLLSISQVKEMVSKYLDTFLSWKTLSIPSIIIRYEDLKSSPVISLRLIRRFLVPFEVEVTNDQESKKRARLMYYFDNTTAFSSNNDRMRQYLREEREKLLCSIRGDLANVDMIYESNKFDALHSLWYYKNSTIEYMVKELLEPLCFMKYDEIFKGYLDIPCQKTPNDLSR